MKVYVITTGTLFGVLTIAHLWRMIEEARLATDPWYVLLTAAVAALCVWAWQLVQRSKRPS